ncbi:SAM-dependent methyltransferase [Desulfosarcina alkanivorans]|uniref:SAM-dependent methyltransferase n=1 Tax=Desulfosarcina alkanivorans TaxID=571177 RepID=A0A5K7YJA6_9BACT|nr:class I SAM-dependent methyltransferase [Desulfosarcina alkanivorans]BBO68475.1 SAM-dependent methyltransferase [Desulfosarcina alkanivorans]
MTVKELFDAGARKYDGNRRKVIYCFDDFYGTLLDLIPFAPADRFSFLDLGAGTGLVSALIRERFTRAEAHLLDNSEKMLTLARERFSGETGVDFYVRDYAREELPGPHPLIVSAMSVHHLSDSEKQRLVQRVFERLTPGGYFIHAELALGATPATEALYQSFWRRHLGSTDIEKEALDAIYQRMACDRPATLDHQLAWMRAAGFADVDCFFKHHNFTVYAGKKTEKPYE